MDQALVPEDYVKNRLRMSFGTNLGEDVLHFSLCIDDEGRPNDALVSLSVVHLRAPRAVLLEHLGFRIGEKREREFVLLRETLMRSKAVFADSDDFRICLCKLW